MSYHVEFDIDFKRNPYKGKYIVIEGIDGSGKTTQAKKVATFLKKKGIEVVLTKEPRKTAGVVGKLINKILKAKIKIPSVAVQYLFSAERAIHHAELIVPALKEGKWVISDRSFWSVVPYGIMDQLSNSHLPGENSDYNFDNANVLLAAQSILSMYHQFLLPDISFYLKISPKEAMKRISFKKDAKEIYEKKEILEKVVKGYEWEVNKFKNEFVIIDAQRSKEEVAKEIIKYVLSVK